MFSEHGLTQMRLHFGIFAERTRELVRTILSFNEYHLMMDGDLNAVQNPALDYVSLSDSAPSNILIDFIKQINIFDIWQLRNDCIRDHTFFSLPQELFMH